MDRPRFFGGEIQRRLAANGQSSESAGLPIRSISPRFPKAASHHEGECEPARRTAICSSWTKMAKSNPSEIPPAKPSASPLAITRPNASAAQSKAATKTNT
ncbi:MAG: hypothetical protein AAFV88_06580 [Planctomycetota bacterium]